MRKRLLLSLFLGIVVTTITSLTITITKQTEVLSVNCLMIGNVCMDVAANRTATARRHGFPFVTSESLDDPNNFTDDFRRGGSLEIIFASQPLTREHLEKNSDTNVVNFWWGRVLNIILYAGIICWLLSQLKGARLKHTGLKGAT